MVKTPTPYFSCLFVSSLHRGHGLLTLCSKKNKFTSAVQSVIGISPFHVLAHPFFFRNFCAKTSFLRFFVFGVLFAVFANAESVKHIFCSLLCLFSFLPFLFPASFTFDYFVFETCLKQIWFFVVVVIHSSNTISLSLCFI